MRDPCSGEPESLVRTRVRSSRRLFLEMLVQRLSLVRSPVRSESCRLDHEADPALPGHRSDVTETGAFGVGPFPGWWRKGV